MKFSILMVALSLVATNSFAASYSCLVAKDGVQVNSADLGKNGILEHGYTVDFRRDGTHLADVRSVILGFGQEQSLRIAILKSQDLSSSRTISASNTLKVAEFARDDLSTHVVSADNIDVWCQRTE